MREDEQPEIVQPHGPCSVDLMTAIQTAIDDTIKRQFEAQTQELMACMKQTCRTEFAELKAQGEMQGGITQKEKVEKQRYDSSIMSTAPPHVQKVAMQTQESIRSSHRLAETGLSRGQLEERL